MCLHDSVDPPPSQPAYQHKRAPIPQKMPTNSGSQGSVVCGWSSQARPPARARPVPPPWSSGWPASCLTWTARSKTTRPSPSVCVITVLRRIGACAKGFGLDQREPAPTKTLIADFGGFSTWPRCPASAPTRPPGSSMIASEANDLSIAKPSWRSPAASPTGSGLGPPRRPRFSPHRPTAVPATD